MIVDDWPGRKRAEASRQWPVLQALARGAASFDGIDGLILLGSFASGEHDEVSDIDVIAVVAPGRFPAVWEERDRLTGDALVSWASGPSPDAGIGWLKWLTRGLVKVECGIVEPGRGGRDLAEPYIVLLGDEAVADRFPRVSPTELEARRRAQVEQPIPDNPNELPYGELIDWKLSELKNAVRRGLRGAAPSAAPGPVARRRVDFEAIRRELAGRCFVCELLHEHHVVFEDGLAVAFLNRYPSLYGHTLVAPRAHREQVTGDFDEEEYVALQRVVHRVGEALCRVVPTERLYVLSLGSREGNAHVHWHLVPLPPGVPFAEQQLAALDRTDCVDLSDGELAALAASLRDALAR